MFSVMAQISNYNFDAKQFGEVMKLVVGKY